MGFATLDVVNDKRLTECMHVSCWRPIPKALLNMCYTTVVKLVSIKIEIDWFTYNKTNQVCIEYKPIDITSMFENVNSSGIVTKRPKS